MWSSVVWRYRNCDPLRLGLIVRRTVEARGADYLTFPQRALFARVGMRSMVLEPDPWGNFIMTGFEYGTPRDWARFGLLHLWDGVWRPTGERVLPEGWGRVQRHYEWLSRKVGASSSEVGTTPPETATCRPFGADLRRFPVRCPHILGDVQPKHQLCGRAP